MLTITKVFQIGIYEASLRMVISLFEELMSYILKRMKWLHGNVVSFGSLNSFQEFPISYGPSFMVSYSQMTIKLRWASLWISLIFVVWLVVRIWNMFSGAIMVLLIFGKISKRGSLKMLRLKLSGISGTKFEMQ